MEIILTYCLSHTYTLILMLALGFVLLVKGADWLVDGASAIAKRMGVSDLIIGLTVVAFGTSMPEFVVNMVSAAEGSTELAITNILGSNTINVFVILGLTALIWPVTSEPESRKVDIPIACAGALLVMLCACVTVDWNWPIAIILEPGSSFVAGTGGAMLFACFILYMIHLAKKAMEHPEKAESEPAAPLMRVWVAALLILLGLAGLTLGGEMIVKSAVQIATNLHVSEAIIGLTIVALGTSLPELATSCMAAAKHNADLALGNCIGSCTFNIFFVLAISAMVEPLPSYDGIVLDALLAAAGPFLVWLFVVNDKQHQVSRMEGASLALIYAVYLTYRLMTL